MTLESGLENTVTNLVKESLMLHEGNENKSGKLFAMSLFRGLTEVPYSEQPDRLAEMEQVYSTFDKVLDGIRKGITAPSAASKELRTLIGDIHSYQKSPNSSILFRNFLDRIVQDPLPGNSLMYLGSEMSRQLINMGQVKSASKADIFLKEYSQLSHYLSR